MSVSPIDALLQIAAPARPIEPSRGADQGRAFGPALEQAYKAERPRDAAEPVEATDADEEAEAIADDASDTYNAAEQRTEETGGPTGAAADVDESAEADDISETDEVEISDTASESIDEVAAAAVAVNVDIAVQEATSALDGDREAGGVAAEAQETGVNALPANGDSADDRSQSAGKSTQRQTRNSAQAELDGAAVLNQAAAGATATIDAKRAKADAVAVKVTAHASAESSEQSLTGEVNEIGADADSTKEGEPEVAERREPRSAKEDGGQRGELPPIQQTDELTAAIHRRGALLEAGGTGETAATEAAAPQAIESASATTSAASARAAATLDRVAASSLRRADNASSSETGPQIDRPRFVQRVEGALRAAQQRDGRVQVRLAPPELGTLRIELAVQNGVMTAKLEAETPAARNALLDNLPALRERLAEQNIRVEKFDVDIRRDSQGGGNNAPHDRPHDNQESGAQDRRSRAMPAPPKASVGRTISANSSTSDAGLDVRI